VSATAAAAAAAADDDGKHGASASGKYLHQSVAVLGLAIVSMGEELSVDMATRMAGHLLQYGDTAVRRMVPLTLGLLHISDPDYAIVDVLARLTHDANAETAQAAVFALGLVAAGTNNSRVAGLLRALALFYKGDAQALFVVRLAQGLAHMGKGLLSLNPLHADRQLLAPAALAGLLSAALLFVDVNNSLHGASSKWHILLYTLAAAMHPRVVATVAEDGAPITVDVRVGTAVETVGQAGRPKTITGFQTHATPVLLGAKDRAELVDDAHVPLTNTIEGVVILRKNPRARRAARTAAAAAAAADAGGK
jgi:26S proteasome regulatory subunit N1